MTLNFLDYQFKEFFVVILLTFVTGGIIVLAEQDLKNEFNNQKNLNDIQLEYIENSTGIEYMTLQGDEFNSSIFEKSSKDEPLQREQSNMPETKIENTIAKNISLIQVDHNEFEQQKVSPKKTFQSLFVPQKSTIVSGISLISGTNSSIEIATLNLTENNGSKTSNDSQIKKATCVEIDRRDTIADVEILNSSNLQNILQSNSNITSRSTPAKCNLVYFFSPYCPFSTQGSAYVNALARSLPNVPVYGLDSVEYHSINSRYGIMGTPSLVLFHNGNIAGRYNASEFATFYLESFIHHFTDQSVSFINVTSMDFKSNLPSQVTTSTAYALYFAWAFLLICSTCLFLNSEFYAKLTEAVLNNWREAEAQHEHEE